MASRGRSDALRFAAPTSRGTEPVLAAELRRMGIHRTKEGPGVVHFYGGMAEGYRALLRSRVASRVLLELDRFECRDADDLYDGVYALPWQEHLTPRETLAIDFVGTSRTLHHSGFSTLRTKDAVVDRLRDATGQRPDIDPQFPDVRVHVYLSRGHATVSLDLAGRPLHERGAAGRQAGAAPLKETLAAAILLHADWPRQARRGASFVDPMCGSGTLALEAAGMALDRAPNLGRRRWGFSAWRGHDSAAWQDEVDAARQAEAAAEDAPLPRICGWDEDPRVLRHARDNAAARRLFDAVRFERRPLSEARSFPGADAPPRGLLVVNPPYGARLGDEDALVGLYRRLGDTLRRRFTGWTGSILTGSRTLAGSVGLKSASRTPLWNGRIECRLLEFPIRDQAPEGDGPGWRGDA